MNYSTELLSTKLVPPHLKSTTLHRKRLNDLFMQVVDYPVTFVQAEAGYGKSTTLMTHLYAKFDHVAWYTVEEVEQDPFLFLSYLIHSFKSVNRQIGDRSLRLVEEQLTASVLKPCLTFLLNDLVEHAPDPTLLVLDDLHTVADSEEIAWMVDFLVRYLPPHVHFIIGSRKLLEIQSFQRLKATYDLLVIGKQELKFNIDETSQLFRDVYGIEINDQELHELHEWTEGWIIALQMIWKGHQLGAWSAHDRLIPNSGSGVFHYLAKEVFDLQPPLVQRFLSKTCILETLEEDICNLLLSDEEPDQANQSAVILSSLEANGLFVSRIGEQQYRYHRLFQQFLFNHCCKEDSDFHWKALHQAAACYYEQKHQLELALHHYQSAGQLDDIVRIVLSSGAQLLQNGRLELLSRFIESLPKEKWAANPQLLFWRGEADRALSRFSEATQWYSLAETAYMTQQDAVGCSRVYQGHAQLYLDTIQPNKAMLWLQKALKVLGEDYPEERAHLLRQLAENYTNSGQLQQADEMMRQASQLGKPTETDELSIRIALRSGRLTEAKQMVLAVVNREQKQGNDKKRIPRSHREMNLLLSLIDAFLGDASSSKLQAKRGIEIGKQLNSPFVEAVGCIRLGHALALEGHYEEAQHCYQEAIHISHELRVERGKVEAFMGLCMTAGLLGQLEQAESYAREGLELAQNVQDLWSSNLVRLSLGMIWATYGYDEQALVWLEEAEAGFDKCGDVFCLTNVKLWLCIVYHRMGQSVSFQRAVMDLNRCIEAGYAEKLFQTRTLFGPRDLQLIVPCLIQARNQFDLAGIDHVLKQMGHKSAQYHPGYTLQIFTLGRFSVYRGLEEIERKEWKREKSRQLFQLFVARRGQWLQREEIYELLWPDASEEVAGRDFKVALNALSNAIEPSRQVRSDSFFIERLETSYRLSQSVTVWIDFIEFKRAAEKGLKMAERFKSVGEFDVMSLMDRLESAAKIYQGEFLQHDPYLDWCIEHREALRTLYIRVLEVLSQLCLETGNTLKALQFAEQMIESDKTWESAYRILMSCYHLHGNRSMVVATYKKCVLELEKQLRLSPMPETTKLYQRLVRG